MVLTHDICVRYIHTLMDQLGKLMTTPQAFPRSSHVHPTSALEITPSPAVFAHNPHLLQAPNLLGAILDRGGRYMSESYD